MFRSLVYLKTYHILPLLLYLLPYIFMYLSLLYRLHTYINLKFSIFGECVFFLFPQSFFMKFFCILSILLISFLYAGDQTMQQYSTLLLICDLYSFNICSFLLVEKFLSMLPSFILHNVTTLSMCSVSRKSALVTTPRSFTLLLISIPVPNGILYYSKSVFFISAHVFCSNFPSLNFMIFFSAHLYILFRSSCIALFIFCCPYFYTISGVIYKASHSTSLYLYLVQIFLHSFFIFYCPYFYTIPGVISKASHSASLYLFINIIDHYYE